MRFKPENIIIAGIIPGPHEPKTNTINSYVRPLVKELNSLWTDGFTMRHNHSNITVRVALLGTVCDIPATSKIDRFLGHNPVGNDLNYFHIVQSLNELIFLVLLLDLVEHMSSINKMLLIHYLLVHLQNEVN